MDTTPTPANTEAPPAAERYQITWTLTETHLTEFTATRLAEILGVTVEEVLAADDAELEDLGRGLADGLAEVEGPHTYSGISYRNDIDVGAL